MVDLAPFFLMWGAVHVVPRQYRWARVCMLVGSVVWLGGM